MQISEFILAVAGIAGAIFTIYKTVALIVEKIRKCVKFFTDLNEKLETCERHTKENYLRSLQLVIMSSEIPLEERLNAGEEYIKNGGNGEIKAKYKVLQHEYEERQEQHNGS